MRKLVVIFFFLLSFNSYSQTVSVDNTTNSADDLVNLLLNSSCIEFENAIVSSNQSVGYFNNNASSFPINEGIVIRSGNVIDTQGLYTNSNLGSTTVGGGVDSFLQSLSDSSSGTTNSLTDLAYLQFDFTSISTSFSFDFLFASNEYGEFQCLSNDIFAFELEDLVSGTITNLAVIPTTTTPVAVRTIKNSAYNGTCSSTNPTLFSTYNVDNPAASTINMRGHTVVLSASSSIIANHPYRLKMVIADYVSTNYDSAVFIGAGSFNTEFDLGDDQTICSGDEFLLDTGLDNTYTFQWLQNGSIIAGETSPTYTVTEPGTYEVIIDKGTCHIEDTIIFNPLMVNAPQDLFNCENGSATYPFDLTQNDETFLGINSSIFDVYYYESPTDIVNDNPISTGDLSNFMSAGQTIYIRILNNNTGNYCSAIYPFDLIINPSVSAGNTTDGNTCNSLSSGIPYNLSTHDSEVINGQTGSYTITYYESETDAQNGINSIPANVIIPQGTTTITYWIKIEDATNSNCFDVTSVTITINPLPAVDEIDDIVECSQYELLPLTNGTYYSLPGGPTTPGQIQLNTGDILVDGGTYYIFSGPDANGCTNESSFVLTLIDEYVPLLDHCGEFEVPSPPHGMGAYYTDFGGPNGTGTLIPTGTIFPNNGSTTITQPIFYYAEIDGVLCRDEQFDFYIHPEPVVDDPIDVTSCYSYTLPALTLGGNYYSGANGTGTNYPVGHIVSSTETIYVFGSEPHVMSNGNNGSCDINNPFEVVIIDPTQFQDVFECREYYLPSTDTGGYYTQPLGQGTQLDITQSITQSQTIYYFANTTDGANCTEQLSFDITIYPSPAIDEIEDGTFCGEFILPTNSGTYYMLPGGPSIAGQIQLNEGDIIDLAGGYPSGTYYIYNEETHVLPDSSTLTCISEDDFTITIEPFPGLGEAINEHKCAPYTISQPAQGDIYTAPEGPNGTGTIIDYTEEYTATETFYLYYEDPVNGCKIDKEFQKIYSAINLPEYPDVVRCDSYVLPELVNPTPNPLVDNHVSYYILPGGPDVTGQVELFEGDVIDLSSGYPPGTYYVYGINTDNHLANCTQEESFTVTILETPNLSNHPTVDFNSLDGMSYCGDYTLPDPNDATLTYNINYYSVPGGDSANIINLSDYTFSVDAGTSAESFEVWVYGEVSSYDESTSSQTVCYDETSFEFTIHPRPTFEIEDGIICLDPISNETIESYTLVSGLDASDFTVNWYLNGDLVGTGLNYEATQAGTYTAEPIKLTSEAAPDCNYEPTDVIVTASSSAIASVLVSSPFEEEAVATVTITNGIGNYTFQLDENIPQSSNVFHDVSSGEHTITIYDELGNCGSFILTFTVIKYPKFFTPNDDNYNDTWNIWDLRIDHPEAVISIFDRYGKLLKQISPLGNGWDGTYNGEKLPSTDYWFVVDYAINGEEKQFKAHFSMKR